MITDPEKSISIAIPYAVRFVGAVHAMDHDAAREIHDSLIDRTGWDSHMVSWVLAVITASMVDESRSPGDLLKWTKEYVRLTAAGVSHEPAAAMADRRIDRPARGRARGPRTSPARAG